MFYQVPPEVAWRLEEALREKRPVATGLTVAR
jgi:hypothetical protein